MKGWRRQQLLEDLRDAQKECTCENNGDLCNPCQAREAIGWTPYTTAEDASTAADLGITVEQLRKDRQEEDTMA